MWDWNKRKGAKSAAAAEKKLLACLQQQEVSEDECAKKLNLEQIVVHFVVNATHRMPFR